MNPRRRRLAKARRARRNGRPFLYWLTNGVTGAPGRWVWVVSRAYRERHHSTAPYAYWLSPLWPHSRA